MSNLVLILFELYPSFRKKMVYDFRENEWKEIKMYLPGGEPRQRQPIACMLGLVEMANLSEGFSLLHFTWRYLRIWKWVVTIQNVELFMIMSNNMLPILFHLIHYSFAMWLKISLIRVLSLYENVFLSLFNSINIYNSIQFFSSSSFSEYNWSMQWFILFS